MGGGSATSTEKKQVSKRKIPLSNPLHCYRKIARSNSKWRPPPPVRLPPEAYLFVFTAMRAVVAELQQHPEVTVCCYEVLPPADAATLAAVHKSLWLSHHMAAVHPDVAHFWAHTMGIRLCWDHCRNKLFEEPGPDRGGITQGRFDCKKG